jgi:sigma-B regulation protein RsbU (phosphoserine phosphatase)
METVFISTARLILQNGGNDHVIPVETLPFTVGRGADRNLLLADPQVSREHACIDRDAEGFVIRDSGSRHGTFLNGNRVSQARLRSGDRIDFGRTGETIIFDSGEDSTTKSVISRISHETAHHAPSSELETLSLFLKAAQTLSTFSAEKDVLAAMLEYTIGLTGAERGFIFLGESFEAFKLAAGQDRRGEMIMEQPAISYSIVRDAAASKSDFILSDTARDLASGRASIVLNAIRTVVAIPLRCENPDHLLGLLYLDSHSGQNDFSSTSRAVLHTIARQGATLLENLRLLEREREAALLRKELEVAAAIQRQIIPQTLPELPYARMFARTVPCAGVGGDFYDVIPTAGGFVAVIADVCGKGIPAALLASMVQGMLHGQMHASSVQPIALADTVDALNRFVCSHAPAEKFVTLAVLRYTHADSGPAQVELVNCGHVAPLVLHRDGRVESVDDGDLPVGLLSQSSFHSIGLVLAPGDRLVMLSDGITEAEDADGEQFGIEQLYRPLLQADPVSALFGALEQFCNGARLLDDQTVLVIERTC